MIERQAFSMGKQKSKPIQPSKAVGDITMTAHPTIMANLAEMA